MAKVWRCPHCGDTEHLRSVEMVMVVYGIEATLDANGKVEFDYDSCGGEVIWDTTEPYKMPFDCGACGSEFTEFQVQEAMVDEEELEEDEDA